MKRTKEEIINARTFLKAAAKHYGVDFADELNLLGAALDEVEIKESNYIYSIHNLKKNNINNK
jgi:hypothetical protein